MEDTIALLIVADDQLARAGLAAVLSDLPTVEVVGTNDSRAAIDDLLDVYQPALILWDLGWDPAGGSMEEAPLARLAIAPELDVPILALIPAPEYAAAVWRSGVAGLLPRSVATGDLAAALPAVAANLRVFDPAFADQIAVPQMDADLTLAEPLTPREKEVLALLAEGMTNRAIGRALSISEHTAKFHVQSLMGKLGAQSRTEVVVRATRLGLLTL